MARCMDILRTSFAASSLCLSMAWLTKKRSQHSCWTTEECVLQNHGGQRIRMSAATRSPGRKTVNLSGI
jgi:hypothetical protein